ncbi:hypothetical protein AGLY_000270 [Aphis glycines]|uniref:Uncharacterized protein n=1 Tax=Aphis glycines TaxID=307491 RepID=A0A6G0U6H7_APHGL|nr:hypothetical protein AGLY_000270 [Aphis glycines]
MSRFLKSDDEPAKYTPRLMSDDNNKKYRSPSPFGAGPISYKTKFVQRGSLVDNAQIQRREITVPIDSKTFALKSARRPICVIMDIFSVASSRPSTRVRMYGNRNAKRIGIVRTTNTTITNKSIIHYKHYKIIVDIRTRNICSLNAELNRLFPIVDGLKLLLIFSEHLASRPPCMV